MKSKYVGIVSLALIAAIVATLCDKVHVITGTLYYPNPSIDGQPWSTLPGFFVVFITMGLVYDQLVKWLPDSIGRSFSTSSGNYKDFTESMLLFAFVYILSGFGNDYPSLLNGLFYTSFILRLIISPDRIFTLILRMILGLGGIFGEGFLSSLDLFTTRNRFSFMFLPGWLVFIYTVPLRLETACDFFVSAEIKGQF